jgi:hypothetical protein
MEVTTKREKDELYKEVEAELIKELHDYISSCVKSFDFEKESLKSTDCLTNFKCFSYYMLEQYRDNLVKRRALNKCK